MAHAIVIAWTNDTLGSPSLGARCYAMWHAHASGRAGIEWLRKARAHARTLKDGRVYVVSFRRAFGGPINEGTRSMVDRLNLETYRHGAFWPVILSAHGRP